MDRDNIQYDSVQTDETISPDKTEDKHSLSADIENQETGCFKSLMGFLWSLYRFLFTGYLPENLYTTDFRLFFTLTAI